MSDTDSHRSPGGRQHPPQATRRRSAARTRAAARALQDLADVMPPDDVLQPMTGMLAAAFQGRAHTTAQGCMMAGRVTGS